MTSGYQECSTCRARVLLVRGVPPLNYTPDPAGMVAVSFANPRTARWLHPGERPTSLEHRHSKHICEAVAEPGEPQRHADHGPEVTCRPAGNGLCEPYTGPSGGVQEWRDAIAGLHRRQRGRRARRREPEISGVVVPPADAAAGR